MTVSHESESEKEVDRLAFIAVMPMVAKRHPSCGTKTCRERPEMLKVNGLVVFLVCALVTACSPQRGTDLSTTQVASSTRFIAEKVADSPTVRITLTTDTFTEEGKLEWRLVYPELTCEIDKGPVRLPSGESYCEAEAKTHDHRILVQFRSVVGNQVDHDITVIISH